MLDYITSRYEQFIKDLETIVNIDSGSHCTTGIEQIIAFFQDRFSQLNWVTRVHHFDDGKVPCLEATNVKTPGADTVFDFLFLGHMDTVFLEGTAQARPFTIEENRARGPGVCDMKGGLVALLHIMETLEHFGIADELSICVDFNSDEEIGSKASRPWFEEHAGRSRRAFIFEPCRVGGQRVLQRKGGGGFEVSCYGKAAHAGVEPEKGANAVVEMAHQIIEIAGFGDLGLGTTVNVNVIQGGTKKNVIAEFARASVDVRVADGNEIKRIESCFRQLEQKTHVEGVTVKVEGGINRPPMTPSEKTFYLWRQIKKIGTQIGQELKLVTTGGGSDGNFTSAMGIPTIDGMGPRGGNAHSEDEFMDLESIVPTVHLISEICKAEAEEGLN